MHAFTILHKMILCLLQVDSRVVLMESKRGEVPQEVAVQEEVQYPQRAVVTMDTILTTVESFVCLVLLILHGKNFAALVSLFLPILCVTGLVVCRVDSFCSLALLCLPNPFQIITSFDLNWGRQCCP